MSDELPERRNTDREIAQIRSAIAEMQTVLVQVRRDAHAKLLALRALAGLVVMGIVVAVLGAMIANSADNSADNVDETITSVIAEARAAQADPVNVAATARARERIIAICTAVHAVCPTEPSTTTTTIGRAARPDG